MRETWSCTQRQMVLEAVIPRQQLPRTNYLKLHSSTPLVVLHSSTPLVVPLRACGTALQLARLLSCPPQFGWLATGLLLLVGYRPVVNGTWHNTRRAVTVLWHEVVRKCRTQREKSKLAAASPGSGGRRAQGAWASVAHGPGCRWCRDLHSYIFRGAIYYHLVLMMIIRGKTGR